jgi:urease accessory protein
MRVRLALATAVTMVPTAAFAHPGDPGAFGFMAGLVHPMTGADHLTAAMLVGVLGALSRRTPPMLGAFLAALAAGLLIGHALPHAAWIAELGIVPGFAALAVAFLLRRAAAWMLPAAAAAAGVAHGLAHGSQATGATAYAAGVLAATAALAGAGYLVARRSEGRLRTSGRAE